MIMEYLKQIQRLNTMLLAEMPEYQPQAQDFPQDTASQRRLLRSLMNVRPPMPLKREFLAIQDNLLSAEREAKGVVEGAALPPVNGCPQIAVWKGDITRLRVDAIVDADNAALLGCFCPCHGCIDNAIHSAAGLQLRDECHQIMQAQGHPEPTGRAKLTKGYNLPARYIPTGEFHFPNQEAAEIAVKAVKDFLWWETSIKKVIFNVFKDIDETIYHRILRADSIAETGP